MTSILDRVIKKVYQKKLDYSSVMIVYQTDEETWRGFVVPFDITFESDSKEEVISVLKNMINSYVEGLHEYKNPTHLEIVPLSYEEDLKKWSSVSQELSVNLMNKISKIESTDYYAEAQLPA